MWLKNAQWIWELAGDSKKARQENARLPLFAIDEDK